jgi:leucine-rich repeat protein SHOC2
MTVLHLTHNRLMSMPPEIGYWTSLTELSVASNRLTALPIELGLLTILSRLDIAHNEISVPPAEVRHLRNARLRIITRTCPYFLPFRS